MVFLPLAVLKFLAFLTMACVFILHHQIVGWLICDESQRQRFYLQSIQRYCRLGSWILGLEAQAENTQVQHGKLLVSNHLSYIDILILFSHYPSLFITSVEIRDTFLLGRMTKLAGCFFVERRRARRSHQTMRSEVNAIRGKLNQGFNVFLFPEGTSSDGTKVLPFKSTFFQTAIDASVPVIPLCLSYDSPVVCWHGSMTFADHLFRVCRLKKIRARLTELPLIPTTGELMERSSLRDVSYQRISGAYAQA